MFGTILILIGQEAASVDPHQLHEARSLCVPTFHDKIIRSMTNKSAGWGRQESIEG